MQSDIPCRSDQRKLVIFTDLDGTLLDHETYSAQSATDALVRLRELGVPLIFASSKTAAEIRPIRQNLGFDHCPAIVENGAGLLEAGRAANSYESTYQALLSAVDELPPSLKEYFVGFSDWSARELAAQTGLTVPNAILAKKRQFSEPGVWLGDEKLKTEFARLLGTKNITVEEGGRFSTLSFGGNKADQVSQLTAEFKLRHGDILSIALGDAANDIRMLQSVDLGVIIPNPSHSGIPPLDSEADGSIIRAALPGPSGWNQSIISILDNPEKYGN